MTETTSTNWIKPGAKVLVVYQTNIRVEGVKVRTVNKVAGKSFTVEGMPERFQLSTCKTKSYAYWHYHALELGSERAMELLDQARKNQLLRRARSAIEKWERQRTRETRLAAIAALQQVKD
jgi:hypothetical protein